LELKSGKPLEFDLVLNLSEGEISKMKLTSCDKKKYLSSDNSEKEINI
jgi:hypothetical protein